MCKVTGKCRITCAATCFKPFLKELNVLHNSFSSSGNLFHNNGGQYPNALLPVDSGFTLFTKIRFIGRPQDPTVSLY